MVPVSHQVYEWLHLQRVKGNLSQYSYETLPLNRKQILDQLKELYKKEESLNKTDHRLLEWYYQEFSPTFINKEKPETYLQNWEPDISSSIKEKWNFFLSDEEPHLFAYRSDSVSFVLDYLFSAGGIYVNDSKNSVDDLAKLNYYGFRSYTTIYNTVGGHIEVTNPISSVSGMLRYHPEWGQTFDGMRESSGSTLYSEAYVSVQYKQIGIHIGNGDLKYGFRGDEAQILRQDAGNFDWVRLNFDSKYLQYTFLHGALRTQTTVIDLEGYPGVKSRVAPERWFALRRFQFTPTNWLTAAFTESLIYSNRPADLSYMNPLFPLRIGEYEGLDRDNPIWFFDGSIRPLKNLELYSTLGIDDLLTLSDIFKSSSKRTANSATISYQLGINYSLPSSTLLNLEVLQFDPYFYTHWQLLNTYDELGSPLGSSIGPNSRQYFISIRQWLPHRSYIDISFGSVKKGFNIIDDNGELVLDVGGDLFEGETSVNSDAVDLFAGEIHEWNQIKLKFEFEPIRGFRFFGAYNARIVKNGLQIDDQNIIYGGLELNFYPIIPNILSAIPVANKVF